MRESIMKTRKRTRGFTLVELVIVVVILGVIAAIAVPRISRGAKGADESALRQDLAILRASIEIYSAEHGGVLPGAAADGGGNAAGTEAAFLSQMLQYSDKQGNTSATKTATAVYGPYLRKQMPPLPVGTNAGKNTIKMVNLGTTPVVDILGGFGWVYDYTTGALIANADNADDTGVTTYDTW